MKTDLYLKLQKKFGGKWVATNKAGSLVFATAKTVNNLFQDLKKRSIHPQKTAIGFIEKYGQTNAYLSLSIQTH